MVSIMRFHYIKVLFHMLFYYISGVKSEIDLLLNTIVVPNINYALSVYAVSESNLTPSCTMFLRPLF